jgi:hypothetical protein
MDYQTVAETVVRRSEVCAEDLVRQVLSIPRQQKLNVLKDPKYRLQVKRAMVDPSVNSKPPLLGEVEVRSTEVR